jgi:hypothetical protein
MRSTCAAALLASTLACVAVAPSAYAADEKDDWGCIAGKDGVGLGFVFPSPGCKQTFNLDTTLSAVSNTRGFEPRLGFEAGWARQMPSLPTFHVGPVFDVLLTDVFSDTNPDASVDLVAGIRGRYWFGPSYPFMFLDLAAGPMVTIPTIHEKPDRVGLYGEAGMSLHGAIGVFASVEPTWSTADRRFGLRYSVGLKTTALGALLILGAFACAQGGGSCVF